MSVLSIRRLRFFLLAFVWAAPAVVADTVLITGANSGIGLEFAKQYAADGWQVIATHRRNSTPASLAELKAEYDNVRIETIDVTNSAMIAAAAARLDGLPIDILINNAGIVGTFDDTTQHFGSIDFDELHRFIDINAAGPLRVSEAFYDNVVASKQKKIVAISSAAGSMTMVQRAAKIGSPLASRYLYNMSKAALNMSFIGLASDSAGDGVSVATYHPGLVRVARTKSYVLSEEMRPMILEVQDSVKALRQRFAELSPESSGSFLNYDGDPMPW